MVTGPALSEPASPVVQHVEARGGTREHPIEDWERLGEVGAARR